MPPSVPMIALTATVTKTVKEDVISLLEMDGCKVINVSPNHSNIYYEVRTRSDESLESDLAPLVENLRARRNKAERVIVYCRTVKLCVDIFEHFQVSLGEDSYFPPGASKISLHRLFGMYHAQTLPRIKEHILSSMCSPDGIVRIVFATVALGMGVNFAGLNSVIHYGAPSSIDDYFQESGRCGRLGDQATSVIYWQPRDCPLRKDLSNPRDAEVAAVRRYVANHEECRRYQLIRYFDPELSKTLPKRDILLCCDVCAKLVSKS